MDDCKRIGKMDALMFALSLEVLLQQLRIWECSSEIRASTWTSLNETERLQRDKLVRDRETIKDVMRKTLINLATNGEWNALHKTLKILQKRSTRTSFKKMNYLELMASCEEMQNTLNAKRNEWAYELRNADQKVAILRDKMQDYILNATTRLNYAEMVLGARAEELELRYQMPRPSLPRSDHEERVHIELCKAYGLQIQEREKAAEHWRMRYSEDTYKMDKLLASKTEQLKAIIILRTERQALYDLHEGEMRSWLSFKRQRAERLEREERNRTSATRIQAWWRGVMVRRALGQFRYLKTIKKPSAKSKKK